MTRVSKVKFGVEAGLLVNRIGGTGRAERLDLDRCRRVDREFDWRWFGDGFLVENEGNAGKIRPVFAQLALDPGQVALTDPLQHKTIRCQQADTILAVRFETQGLDPGTELLCRQLLLESGETERPEIVSHRLIACRNSTAHWWLRC